MKRFVLLILFGIILIGCCPTSPSQDNQPSNRPEVKILGRAYHDEKNCNGHDICSTKYEFQDNGHDMWLYICFIPGYDYRTITPLHSPDCRKCNPDKEEESSVEEPKSDYWGW